MRPDFPMNSERNTKPARVRLHPSNVFTGHEKDARKPSDSPRADASANGTCLA